MQNLLKQNISINSVKLLLQLKYFLQELSSKRYLEDYFNPYLQQLKESPTSYMLIVYTSSSTDEIVDLEVTRKPGEDTP